MFIILAIFLSIRANKFWPLIFAIASVYIFTYLESISLLKCPLFAYDNHNKNRSFLEFETKTCKKHLKRNFAFQLDKTFI